MKHNTFFNHKHSDGQGLVEYSLLLTLVSIVVIIILSMLGASVNDVFCRVNAGLNGFETTGGCDVAITKADYNGTKIHLDATVSGDYDPTVTLTASPGGVMEARNDHYHLNIQPVTCPCTIVVTSSMGGSSTVNVP